VFSRLVHRPGRAEPVWCPPGRPACDPSASPAYGPFPDQVPLELRGGAEHGKVNVEPGVEVSMHAVTRAKAHTSLLELGDGVGTSAATESAVSPGVLRDVVGRCSPAWS